MKFLLLFCALPTGLEASTALVAPSSSQIESLRRQLAELMPYQGEVSDRVLRLLRQGERKFDHIVDKISSAKKPLGKKEMRKLLSGSAVGSLEAIAGYFLHSKDPEKNDKAHQKIVERHRKATWAYNYKAKERVSLLKDIDRLISNCEERFDRMRDNISNRMNDFQFRMLKKLMVKL